MKSPDIGLCGLCGCPLQRLLPEPPPGADPGWWRYTDPGDSPELGALKAHVAIVHDELAYLPELVKP